MLATGERTFDETNATCHLSSKIMSCIYPLWFTPVARGDVNTKIIGLYGLPSGDSTWYKF